MIRVTPRRVEKPWGRRNLPPPFANSSDSSRSIGEIIFDSAGDGEFELLIKFLFTSEKLSIQVHPDDRTAKKNGRHRGKDEAWIILAAEPGSKIGIGLNQRLSKEGLRRAALDGSLEAMIDWRSVAAGEVYYSPAGTIHAIGPGLTLLEIQQNSDVTYRLYDYGRPRELHLTEAIEVASVEAAPAAEAPLKIAPGRTRLAGGPAFQIERLAGGQAGRLVPDHGELWVISTDGRGQLGGCSLGPGEVWRVEQASSLQLIEGSLFLAYPGPTISPVWQQHSSGSDQLSS